MSSSTLQQPRVTFRELPHALLVMIGQRLPVHPRIFVMVAALPLARLLTNMLLRSQAARGTMSLSVALEEVRKTMQQALCAWYGLQHIEDIPADLLVILLGSGDTERMLRLVVARCPLDLQNRLGNTALIEASYQGKIEIAKVLIGAGANLDLKTHGGDTAYSMASGTGNTEIVAALKEAGCVHHRCTIA